MRNLYSVTYARETGLDRTDWVWAVDSEVAVERVRCDEKKEVDYIVQVGRISGVLILSVALVLLTLVLAAAALLYFFPQFRFW